MAWAQQTIDRMADILRFAARGALRIATIAVSVGVTYVVVKVSWFGARWLDRIWFSKPW